ncbi:MAG: SAM-dependent methyltransferase [Halieaceae bacterium]|jgi:SAM-dependent methyltransferase
MTAAANNSATARRGSIGRMTRFPRLDGESYQQFATRSRCSISCQQMTWEHMRAELAREEGARRAELEVYDQSGLRSVSVDPALDIPAYARHEVHLQPGGYVGDELAGYLFHFGTNNFYHGMNDQDEFHIGVAERVEPPAGRLERIVDLGCGVGQLTVALKERFPQAEVLGLDVGAPMVRYAHRRAVDRDVDVHFHQALAHDTGFEDGCVDLVTAYILFYEVPTEIGREIVAEAFRILRSGGVFEVYDFATPFAATAPYQRYTFWVDHRFSNEPWSAEFTTTDFTETLREAGFDSELAGHQRWGVHRYRALKPAL